MTIIIQKAVQRLGLRFSNSINRECKVKTEMEGSKPSFKQKEVSNCSFLTINHNLRYIFRRNNAQKIKFSIKAFSSKCDQIRSLQRSWSYLLEKSLTENFIFCAVKEGRFLIGRKMSFSGLRR